MRRRFEANALDDLLASLDAHRSRERVPLDDLARAIRIAESIARRARLDRDTCLERALARYAILRRAGHAPRFVMGIDEENPDRGHAWIELGGAPFLEPALPPYRRTLEHPRRA
jgi:hypothetical protein